jgi:hypothetical protein
MSVTFTPVYSTVHVFVSATARFTNSSGLAQQGQCVLVVRVVNVNTGAEVGHSASVITDYDDVNGVSTSGTIAISGVPAAVTANASTTFKLQWYAARLQSSSPWQLRIDPTLANIGDHAVLTIIDK